MNKPLPVFLPALLAAFAATAASISSPSIGEFVTLPSWMPTSVDAAHTPGCEASAGMSLRIDSNLAAAMAAVEEAFWERWYFLGGIADIPPQDLVVGSTGKMGGLFPVEREQYYPWFWSYPTNRLAFPTRRIAETNYLSIVRELLSDPTRPWACYDNMQNARRASAWDDEEGAHYFSIEQLSSSLFGDSTPVFPNFNWIDGDSLPTVLSGWRGAIGLNACTNLPPFGFYNQEWDSLGGIHPILMDAFAGAITNQNTREAFVKAHRLASPGSFQDILTNAFPNAFLALTNVVDSVSNYVVVVTNSATGVISNYTVYVTNWVSRLDPRPVDYGFLASDSRRLMRDRLAGANQTIAAIDRTFRENMYAEWNPPMTQTVTHVYGSRRGSFSGADLVVTNNAVFLPKSAVTFEAAQYESAVTNTFAGWTFDPVAEVSAITASAGVFPTDVGRVDFFLTAEDFANIRGTLDAVLEYDFKVSFADMIYEDWSQSYHLNINLEMRYSDGTSGWFPAAVTKSAPISALLPSGTRSFILGGSAEATTLQTYRPTGFTGLGWPTQYAFSSGRVKEVEIAALMQAGLGASAFDIPPAKVRCQSTTVNSWSAAFDFAYSQVLDAQSWVATSSADLTGYAPAAAYSECRRLVTAAMNEFVADHHYEVSTDISTIRTAGQVVYDSAGGVASLVFTNGTGRAASLSLSVEGSDTARETEYEDARATVWMNFTERVDWNWKALRLSNDNH